MSATATPDKSKTVLYVIGGFLLVLVLGAFAALLIKMSKPAAAATNTNGTGANANTGVGYAPGKGFFIANSIFSGLGSISDSALGWWNSVKTNNAGTSGTGSNDSGDSSFTPNASILGHSGGIFG